MIETVCGPVRHGGSSVNRARRSGADAPLASLANSGLASRFRHWHGPSGTRYLFSVYPLRGTDALDRCPRYEDAVMLAVSRAEDGSRRLIWVGQTGSLPDLVFDGPALHAAVRAGADELHIHLLAKDRASRDAVVRDIAVETGAVPDRG